MANTFPFVQIPPELREIIGDPTPGTRFFRRSGTSEECSQWFDAISQYIEPGAGVSPGGVSMFVPVSRSAVHHRLQNGMLTGFSFYVTEDEKSFFGTTRKRKERPYVYIPVSECKAWAEELKRRSGVTDDEPKSEGEIEEGWQFVLKDPKDKGNKKVVYKEPPMTREEIILEIQTELRFAAERILAKLLPGELGEKHRKRLGSGLNYNHKTKTWSWGNETKRKPK
jgi:hypothetical protein